MISRRIIGIVNEEFSSGRLDMVLRYLVTILMIMGAAILVHLAIDYSIISSVSKPVMRDTGNEINNVYKADVFKDSQSLIK